MKALFSPSLVAFIPDYMAVDGSYSTEISGSLVAVTDEELAIYWRQIPPVGKTLGVAIGRPIWVDLPPPLPEELIDSAIAKKNQLKAVADSEIDWRQDAVDGSYAEGNEATELAAWKKYRVLLMRIDTSKAPDIIWPLTP
ncbi:TPA: tail fiber assembly protein [Yersinia enterocolitica]